MFSVQFSYINKLAKHTTSPDLFTFLFYVSSSRSSFSAFGSFSHSFRVTCSSFGPPTLFLSRTLYIIFLTISLCLKPTLTLQRRFSPSIAIFIKEVGRNDLLEKQIDHNNGGCTEECYGVHKTVFFTQHHVKTNKQVNTIHNSQKEIKSSELYDSSTFAGNTHHH